MTSDGTCRLVMPRSESTMASSGPSARPAATAALMASPSGSDSTPASSAPRPSLAERPAAASASPYSVEDLGEERPDHVAEDDRVGDLHHRGLEVDREEHALGLGAGDLLGEERVERGGVHERAVDDLAREHRHRLLEHGDAAVVGDVLDTQGVVGGHHHRLLVGEEVVVPHRGHVGLTVARPGTHRVRVGPGVVLDRRRGAAVGVALAQHRVDRGAHDLVVAGADVALLVGGGVVGVVGQVIALLPELGDGGLELRDRGGDVGQLDDVGLGPRGQLTELGQRVADLLLRGQPVGEPGKDPAGERDVAGHDVDAGLGGVRPHDRQEGVRREEGRLIGVGVDDLLAVRCVRHAWDANGGSARRQQRGSASVNPAERGRSPG